MASNLAHIIPPGTIFGRLTVQARVQTTLGWRYACQCSCGGTAVVYGWCLKKGATRSCGCIRSEKGLTPGQAGFLLAARDYRKGARARKVLFDLTDADLAHLFSQDCHYCGAPPSRVVPTQTPFGHYARNGIDRVDNTKGYSQGNVVTACWTCNRVKGTQTTATFLLWAQKVHHPTGTPVLPLEPTKAEEALYRSYQDAARRRGKEFLLSASILANYFRSPCAYCGAPPANRGPSGSRYTGIDRVDNEVGYECGNTLAACKQCNYAKRDGTLAEFLAWARRLQQFQASR